MTSSPVRTNVRARAVAIVLVATLGVAGCSSTSSQAASGSAGPTGSSTPSGSSRGPSPNPSTSPDVPTPISTPLPTPTPTPTTLNPSPVVLPTVGAAPAGAWTSIDWVSATRAIPVLGPINGGGSDIAIYGWSGGFLAFGADGGRQDGSGRPPALRASASADGLRWSAARTLDVTTFVDGIDVVGVVEGPAGLLALGQRGGDTCGGPPTIDAVWRSTDGGATWKRIRLPASMTSSAIHTVDAGSSGYIASGLLPDGETTAIWLSSDGVAWREHTISGAPFGKLVIDDATSFRGGFVLTGAILGEGECGGPSHESPSIWWSASGGSWARQTLPGASSAAAVSMSVRRLSDQVLVAVAIESNTDGNDRTWAWTTTDGRTWAPTPNEAIDLFRPILTETRHAILVMEPPDYVGPLGLATVGPNLAITNLTPHGEGPVLSEDRPGYVAAVGPTGVLIASGDGSSLWLGVPRS